MKIFLQWKFQDLWLLLKNVMWFSPTDYTQINCNRTMGSYWKLLLVFIVSSLFLFLSCHGTTNNQLFYNFPINSLLTCRVPNQAAGQQASMPEPRFRVPLQPGATGTVWRPALSQWGWGWAVLVVMTVHSLFHAIVHQLHMSWSWSGHIKYQPLCHS